MREYNYLPEVILPHDKHLIEVETEELEYFTYHKATYTVNSNKRFVTIYVPLRLEIRRNTIGRTVFKFDEIKSITVDGKNLILQN